MKLLFTICARAGSKGIKNKNYRLFCGHPLFFYSLSVIDLYKSQHIDHECMIALNTDSEELIELIKEKCIMNVEIIPRNPVNATDRAPKVPVIKESYLAMKHIKNIEFDMIIDLDVTSPLRTVHDLEALIEKKANSAKDIVFSVTDARRNPYFNMVKKSEDNYIRVIQSDFNTRQEAPEIYDMNASMYAYSSEFLLSGKAIFEAKCDIIKMMDTAILDLDHENDFELMEVIANYLYVKYPQFSLVRNNIQSIMK